MVYFGHIKDGKVVPDPGVRLPEGTRVRIEPVEAVPAADDPAYRLYELATDDSLPPDLAHEHDHYIYGTPKKGS